MPLLWALACGGGKAEPIAPAPAPPRGLPRVAATERAPVKQPAEAAPEPFRWPDDKRASKADSPAATSPDAGQRDYGAELQAALGDPSSCLTARSASDVPSEIRIDVEAYVMAAGNVSRGYVRSAQLAPGEVECIRKRINPLRFRAPIEDAPRAVRTTLKLVVESSAKTGT
jgi:hypothetical protein